MDLGLKGKRAVVLGSSSGIGLGIAGALKAEGAAVCLVGRDVGKLQSACTSIGAEDYYSIDLRKKDAGLHLIDGVVKKFGDIDVLVTNTGGPTKGTFESIADSDWEEQFQNLMLSTMQAIRAALPAMRANRWGRVLLITSVAAIEPIANLTVSNVLRSGLLGLVNSLSKEVAADGITVNTILPGYTKTERLAELGRSLETIAQLIPAGRLGTPEELGLLAAFLCSECASYITGQAIAYDGGLTQSI